MMNNYRKVVLTNKKTIYDYGNAGNDKLPQGDEDDESERERHRTKLLH